MGIRVFRYVLAVAEHRHFRRAAEACDVSQSTLSTQVRKLEAYLDTEIFIRHTNGVDITEAGQRVISLSHEVITAIDEMRSISATTEH